MENENLTKQRKYFEGRGYRRDYFCNIDTEEKAYILGFLWGDGSYIPSKRTIALAISVKDKLHLHRIASSIGLEPDQVRTHTSRAFGDQEFRYVKIQMSHKTTFESMKQLGYGYKRDRMRKLPPIPDDLVRHFIRGLFDADGCAVLGKPKPGTKYAQHQMQVCLPHMEAVTWWKEYFLNNLEIQFGHHPDKSIFSVSISAKASLEKVYHYLYDDATLYLKRKHVNFKLFLGPDDKDPATALPRAA